MMFFRPMEVAKLGSKPLRKGLERFFSSGDPADADLTYADTMRRFGGALSGRIAERLAPRILDCGQAVEDFRTALAVHDQGDGQHLLIPAERGTPTMHRLIDMTSGPLVALLPPLTPESLGSGGFVTAHGCRYPYVVGEMARGIATAAMVVAAGRAGFLGFFGSAGLDPAEVEGAIEAIRAELPDQVPFGMNLIHTPNHPDMEKALVELYLRKKVRHVSASAFLRPSPQVVRLSAAGLSLTSDGAVERKTRIFAKISRPEVARVFIEPPSADLLRELAAAGLISDLQAELQSRLPLAEDITVEADSGGHTDNRPLTVIYPAIDRVRHQLSERHGFDRPIRLGAAGGLGTPASVAAAFQLGADYVLTGSVNQAAVESGLSEAGRELLAASGIADVAMAPAADMFERGVRVQVLKRGTTFHVKARRLYDLYRRYDGLHDLPQSDLEWLEEQIFDGGSELVWQETRRYFEARNPAVAERAETDAKLRMALMFRRYLFDGAHWAREGERTRRDDFQIWCGPAMGAFNEWVRGTWLEPPQARTVERIGVNLLEGACRCLRIEQLQQCGVEVPVALRHFTPRPDAGESVPEIR